MSWSLLFPAGLAALFALVVPLAIHLTRRFEDRRVQFAALRWLSDGPRPKQKVQFDELLLLALRLLLLALLALLLAQPVRLGLAARAGAYVAVVPGVTLARARAAAADVGAAASWHWLAPGFPSADSTLVAVAGETEGTDAARTSTTSLLRELAATLPAAQPLVVVAPPVLEGLDAERPRWSRTIDLRVVPRDVPFRAAPKPAAIKVAVRYAPEREGEVRYVRAAVAAWNAREPDRYTLDAAAQSTAATDADALVWLAPGEAPPGRARVYRPVRPLDPALDASVLEPEFADALHAAIFGERVAADRGAATLLAGANQAAMPDSNTRAALEPTRPRTPLEPVLVLLILALFAIERMLSLRAARLRRRAGAEAVT